MRTHCVTCKITIDNAFMDAATLAVDIDTEEQSAQSASDHLVALSISQGEGGESSAPTEAHCRYLETSPSHWNYVTGTSRKWSMRRIWKTTSVHGPPQHPTTGT